MFKLLFKFNKNSSKIFFLLFLLIVFTSIISIYPINIIMRIIDAAKDLEKRTSIKVILQWGSIYLILQIINSSILSFIDYLVSKFQIEIESKLQIEMFQKLSKINWTFFKNKNSSKFSNLIIKDIDLIGKNCLVLYTQLIGSSISFMVGIYFMWRINPILTIIIIPLGVISSLIIKKVGNESRKNITIHRMFSDHIVKIFNEGIRGILPIRLHNYINEYSKFVEEGVLNLEKSQLTQRKLEIRAKFIAHCFFMISIGMTLIISSLMVVHQTLTIGGLTAILMYNHMIIDPLLQIIELNPQLTQLNISIGRISQIYKEPIAPVKIYSMTNEIKATNLNYSIDGKIILEGIHLHIMKNSSVAIMGKTGIGKTTLVNIIVGLLEPTSGDIEYFFDSQPLSTDSTPKISYMMQDEFIFDDSIKNNIKMANKSLNDDEYLKILQICELDEIEKYLEGKAVGEGGCLLSGGERKRLLIARTICDDTASIYIFDELSSALDTNTFNRIIGNVNRYLDNKIRIYIDHNSEIQNHVDFSIHMDDFA